MGLRVSSTPVLDSNHVQPREFQLVPISKATSSPRSYRPPVPKKISTGRIDGEKTAVDVHDLILQKLGKFRSELPDIAGEGFRVCQGLLMCLGPRFRMGLGLLGPPEWNRVARRLLKAFWRGATPVP